MTDVRWGFLGAGNIARTALGPAVHAADGAVLQAAGARDRDRAAALGPRSAYGSYREVLADPAVDAVYIGLHNCAHLLWTLAALRAGKAVLCEKPLGLTAAEVDEMAAVSAQTGLPVVEASWYRWHPRIQLAAQALPGIAPVTHVAAGFTFAGSLEGNYRLDPNLGGGALYDVGCYAISACLWAVGQGLPEQVVARLELGPSGVDLDARVSLRWSSGATADARAGIAVDAGQWLVIRGDRGVVEVPDAPFTSWRDDATELAVTDGTGAHRFPVRAADAYQLMVEEVSSVLRGGPGWLLPVQESRLTAAVLDAAFASAAAGGSPVRPA